MLRRGDQILFRFVWPWKVFSAMPTTVVERTPERVVLRIAPGTPVRWPPGRRVPISTLAEGDWTHEDTLVRRSADDRGDRRRSLGLRDLG